MKARHLQTVLLLCLLGLSSAAAADEPGTGAPLPDEPAVLKQPASSGPAGPSLFSRRPRGPRFEAFWRTFDVAEMGGRRGRYHMLGADYFFISNIIRLGAGLEGGWDDGAQTNFLCSTDFRLGVQWPSRITPSLDLVLGLGVLGQPVLHETLASFAWQVGLQAAAHVYVHQQVFLSLSLGWRRLTYRQSGNDQVQSVNIYNDSFSIGLGLGF